MLCFAQDNWDLRSQAAYSSGMACLIGQTRAGFPLFALGETQRMPGQGSPNFVAPQPNKVTLAQAEDEARLTMRCTGDALATHWPRIGDALATRWRRVCRVFCRSKNSSRLRQLPGHLQPR